MLVASEKNISLNLTLTLPEGIVQEAKKQGLLTAQALETLIRTELRRARVERFFDAADRLATVNLEPLTDAEVEAEIQAVRRERDIGNESRR